MRLRSRTDRLVAVLAILGASALAAERAIPYADLHAVFARVASLQGGKYVQAESRLTSTDPALPPMGLRLRLKASVDISGYPAPVRAILTALKRYGMLVADNGSSWYISGAPDPRWDDSDLATLGRIAGSDFEVVDTGPIVTP